jgi:serine/threonine protein phosphatase PrpC
VEIQAKDRLVMVTNGVTRVMNDDLLGRLSSITENDAEMSAHVVNAASTLGTKDDATCVSVSFAPTR